MSLVGMVLALVSMVVMQGPEEQATAQDQLTRGLQALEQDDPEAAVELLLRADQGLGYDELRRQREALGIALAYLGRNDEARRAFEELLAIAPTHALPYTISPKATFVFEQARARMAREQAAEIELAPPLAVPRDGPVLLTVRCRANPMGLVRRWELCHRLKSAQADFSCQPVPDLQTGGTRDVQIPPLAPAAGDGTAHAEAGPEVMQLAVTGYDARDNEVYRGPGRTQPKEILVGVEPAPAWYTSPLLWAAVGAAALVTGTAVAIAVVVSQPTTARLSGQLAP